MNRQYFDAIKNNGYKYSKDNMGWYFDNGDKKFSIIKNGPYMQCFYNKYVNNNWQLQRCGNTEIEVDKCLIWILNIINNTK